MEAVFLTEPLVDYTSAVILRDLGFPQVLSSVFIIKEGRLARPTISQALRWLRGEGINVVPFISPLTKMWGCMVNDEQTPKYAETYEAAAENGIKALKNYK